MGVDAGCDRKCMHFGVFEDDEATINEHCNTTCDSSGSKEPRWVMFPAILQLLPWSETKIEVCGLYKDEEDATMRTFFARAHVS